MTETLAAEMWRKVMEAIIDDPDATPRERELAKFCAEIIDVGKLNWPTQNHLICRARLACER